jgi:hypothetical protein
VGGNGDGFGGLASDAAWRAAEAAHAAALARVAAAQARLDERLRVAAAGPGAAPDGGSDGGSDGGPDGGPDGEAAGVPPAVAGLAAAEAVALAAATGAGRIGLEAFLLWRQGGRQGGADPAALLAAGWAARRLAAAPAPLPADPDGLFGFLEHGAAGPAAGLAALTGRPAGAARAAAAAAVLAALAGLAARHPLTRAAALPALWHRAGLGAGPGALEGAVLALRAGAAGQGTLGFLPLGRLPRVAPVADPARAASDRLGALLGLAGARLAAVAGELERRAEWRRAALRQAAGLPGRVPRALAALLAEMPLLSAGLAAARLGITPQAANAGFRALARAGLARELTGQRRFRVWRATA